MFSIYLLESNKSLTPNYTILDTEDLDVSTVFAISDISDISSRKDTITKNITFKGTQTNNRAFGYHFFLNKHVDRKLNSDGSDDATDEKMFFNYIPSRKVDCMVFEDSILIINGSMLLTSANIDKDGNISYNTTITGKIVTLKSSLGDKLLTGNANVDDDLDFMDLKHQYVSQVIQDSWGASALDASFIDQTQRYDKDTDTYSYTPFEKGSGYVYPFIDYGEKFQDDNYNEDYSRINIHNYRPAIYVKEYLNRIFLGVGYSYELKGDSDFIDRFNSLVIPDNTDKLMSTGQGFPAVYVLGNTSPAITESVNPITDSGKKYIVHPLPIPTKSGTSDFTNYGNDFGTTDKQYTLVQFTNAVEVDGHLDLTITNIENRSGAGGVGVATTAEMILELVRRKFTTDTSNIDDNWDILGTQKIILSVAETIDTFTYEINILPTQFDIGDQLCVRIKDSIWWTGSSLNTPNDACTYSITGITLNLPRSLTASYAMGVQDGDYIVPQVPIGIKQFDFVKSIITLLNLYVYNEKENPTHLYFQSYDDFYSLCKPPYLRVNALNWTNKVDYSQGLIINSNLELPTKYSITFKDDSDYINQSYKDKYQQTFGSYNADDKLGLTDTSTIDVIFSPTPMIEISNLSRIYPFIADGGTSLKDKSVMQSNIRILFFNGGAYTTSTIFSQDGIDTDNNVSVVDQFTGIIYGQASNYYITITSDTTAKTSSYNATHDIHFSHPKEIYFSPSNPSDYLDDTISTSYSYYQNQIQEMINPNLFIINCNALLNEIDIGNLDFRQPIFIDTGEYGHSYFKLQTIEYSDNNTPSQITLQKIVL